MQKSLGGDAGLVGISGSITPGDLALLLGLMAQFCGMSCLSAFLDLGGGTGTPAIHVAYMGLAASTVSVDVCVNKCHKAVVLRDLSIPKHEAKMNAEREYTCCD